MGRFKMATKPGGPQGLSERKEAKQHLGRPGFKLLLASVLTLLLAYYIYHTMAEPMPEIQSKHSLVAKYVTAPLWEKLSGVVTKTAGFTLAKAIACAVQFDDQHCGIYAGDWDSYKDFAEVFDPLIQEYHGISADAVHTSDMDSTKIQGNIDPTAPVKSTRIRVGRNIDGFGLSPGITKDQRLNVEDLMKKAFGNLEGDVKGVFDRLARGISAVGDSVKKESGKDFMLDPKYGYIHACPTNLGTGMRASVHVDLPGFTKEGGGLLKARCEELKVQPRGTRGESGGQTGITYDISNKHRLGYSEVQLVQCMIDGVNTLVKEDRELQKKHGI